MTRSERYAPLTGIVAVVLWSVGTFLLEKTDRPEEDAEFLRWVQGNDTELIAGSFIFGLGVLFFLWFLGSLRATLYAAEGGVGRVTTIAFASGVAVAVSMLFTYLPHGKAAFDVDSLSSGSVAALVLVGDSFFGGIQLFAIPMVAATALVILRTGVLARSVAWFSLVLALVLVLGPIGFFGVFLGLPLWTILVAVLLWLRPAGEPVAPARPPEPIH
jgi:hypothetical protein